MKYLKEIKEMHAMQDKKITETTEESNTLVIEVSEEEDEVNAEGGEVVRCSNPQFPAV